MNMGPAPMRIIYLRLWVSATLIALTLMFELVRAHP
jgi:hypothetical protein